MQHRKSGETSGGVSALAGAGSGVCGAVGGPGGAAGGNGVLEVKEACGRGGSDGEAWVGTGIAATTTTETNASEHSNLPQTAITMYATVATDRHCFITTYHHAAPPPPLQDMP